MPPLVCALPHNEAACHMISPRVKLRRVVMLKWRYWVAVASNLRRCGHDQPIKISKAQMLALPPCPVTFMLGNVLLCILRHGFTLCSMPPSCNGMPERVGGTAYLAVPL